MKVNMLNIMFFSLLGIVLSVNSIYSYAIFDDLKELPGLNTIEICDNGLDDDNDTLVDYDDSLDCFK
jgi:hypothetical protein